MIQSELSKPFGVFAPSFTQRVLIAATRRNRIARAAVRTRVNRLLQWLRPGPIDSSLFGWHFRFFPHENTGDRKALLSPAAFDSTEIGLIARHIPHNGVFLDIGANIGVYSFGVLSKRPDVKVLVFEPSPTTCLKLRYNLAVNGLEQKISLFEVALSDAKGKVFFDTKHESLKHFGSSSISVDTDTLLDVLRSQNIDTVGALKIDVEGAEDNVLQPFFREAPSSLWPGLIVIEHVMPEQWEWNCLEFIESHGYKKLWRGGMNTVYVMAP